jgi:imidazolonepropionase-like amidohydrolase
VVREGALADLLLVNGNPLDDLDLIPTPDTSLAVIMKDGKIHENLVGPALPKTDDGNWRR